MKWLLLALLISMSVAIIWGLSRGESGKAPATAAKSTPPVVGSEEPAMDSGGAPKKSAANPGVPPEGESNFPDFKKRPLPVARRSTTHEWTEGDARDPKLVEKIAHNDNEFIRLMEENERIVRRQLVYRNDTAAAVIQRSKLTGVPVTRMVLPGLDGKEFEFEITRADLAPSGQSGTLAGNLTGHPTSMVTLAFKFGREAFTITSPEDGIFLQGDPREPGEIIVASFDPNTYQSEPGGEPIESSEPFKPAE